MFFSKKWAFSGETTTQIAIKHVLEWTVEILSFPWSWTIQTPDITRSEITQDWVQNGIAWWPFCLLTLLIWGAIPRYLFAVFAKRQEARLLNSIALNSPAINRLYRTLTPIQRGPDPQAPPDSALVITLGSIPDQTALRPYFLQKLRVNPIRWETAEMIDNLEDLMKEAPAGIVLLEETWALAPRRLEPIMEQINAVVGDQRRVLVADGSGDSNLRRAWEEFVNQCPNAAGWELHFTQEKS